MMATVAGGVGTLVLLAAAWRFRPRPPADGSAKDPYLGQRFGGYVLEERLGEGSWAVVYRGRDVSGLPGVADAAVKLLRPETLTDGATLRRVQRELAIWKELKHPNLVALQRAGEKQGVYFVVMDLVRGIPLRRKILPAGMPPAAVWKLVEPLLGAVHALHEQGVMHRDLKPDNVMLAEDGRVVLMDFGLLKDPDVEYGITDQRSIVGTPAYMAPEQVLGKPCLASDQYALGVLTYELLTGRTPFLEADTARMLHLHLNQPPDPPSAWRSLNPAVDKAVLRMLAKYHEERFESLEQASLALGRALTS